MSTKYIKRDIHDLIEKKFFSGKAIVILGARQVGKTTFLKQFLKKFPEKVMWLNADNPEDRDLLDQINSTKAKSLFIPDTIVIIDEAQRLANSGLTLKIIHDSCENIQLIATGSSSFEISDKIKEALTGRKWTFTMFSFSISEIAKIRNTLEILRTLDTRLIYGSYPDVINHPGNEKEILLELVSDYLYKDVFSLKDVRKPDILEKITKALALQTGSQVSYREISNFLDVDKGTVERYIYLLEQAFVIFRLPSYAKNLRNELKQSRKIYFYDNGVRNAVLNQFAPLSIRNDTGALWENYLISERLKLLHNSRQHRNMYFWRTTLQQEIDYIEETDGEIAAFEFKWGNGKKNKHQKAFTRAYPDSKIQIIDRDNFLDFLM